MNTFPFLTPLEGGVVTSIENVNRATFSQATPFVLFTDYVSQETIGTSQSYLYSNPKAKGERFPPVITNLEVKPTGNMGVIREGSVTIKFASMPQLKSYQSFFRIGTGKSIQWGWNLKRDGKPSWILPLGCDQAKPLTDNIEAWQNFCRNGGYSKDVIVGPLMDFSISVNDDATVDVIFKIGSKSEIPAFLGNTDKTKDSTTASAGAEKYDGKLSSLFNLSDGEFKTLKSNYDEFRKHLINYGYANRGSIAEGISYLSEMAGLSYDSTSDSVYVDMDWVVRFAINKNNGGENTYIVNIDNSVGCAHINMLSNSENVIFTNKNAATPQKQSDGSLKLDLAQVQDLTHLLSGQTYVQAVDKTITINGTAIPLQANKYGYVKNIFIKQEFLEELFKKHTNGVAKDILEDICIEINKASAGLTEFHSQEAAHDGSAKMIYTIVDYALSPPPAVEIPVLNLFGANTTITGINFTSDLPKEIAAMAMLKDRDQKNREIGKNLFFAHVPDCVLDYNKSDKKITIEPGTGVPADAEKGVVQKTTDVLTDIAEKVKSGVETVFSAAKDIKESITGIAGVVDENCTIISYEKNEREFNKPLDENGFKVSVKDTQLLKNLYFGEGNDTPKNNPLLPVELEITTLGISGITVGKVVKILELPFQDPNGLLQVIEVNHTVTTSSWDTTIKFKYRPGN